MSIFDMAIAVCLGMVMFSSLQFSFKLVYVIFVTIKKEQELFQKIGKR